MIVEVPTSVGELIDKITILEIKADRIEEPAKRDNAQRELELLEERRVAAGLDSPDLSALRAELKALNEQLWQVEDDIRLCERAKDFGPRFVALARSVYELNDRRFGTKKRINDLTGSEIVEEKSYQGAA